MYPKNSATPPIIAVGSIYLIADGTIQTSGASVRVKTGAGAWGAGGGTLAYDTTGGAITYTPTQAETNDEEFLVTVYKASCTSASVTVITTASSIAGMTHADVKKADGEAIQQDSGYFAVQNEDNNKIPIASEVVNEWETQSQEDPTGFHVNVMEVNGTAQTANDNGADINAILVDTSTTLDDHLTDIKGTNFIKDVHSLFQILAAADQAQSYGSDILDDTNELQTNQGNWLTATSVTVSDKTGFKLASDGLDLQTAWTVAITGNITGNLSGSVASVTNPVVTDAASRTASKADVSGLATSAELADGTVQVGTVQDGAIGAAAVADIFSTTAIAEAYPADGSAGTPAQVLYLVMQSLHEFAISSTTRTVKKIDGSTTAATFTLDDADNPTSTTRAT